jgi:hypothetical protein
MARRDDWDYTMSQLNASELADLWSSIRSTPCYRDASGELRAWTDLLAAVAARDAPEIVSKGTVVLERSSLLTTDELAYLTTVMASAYIHIGQMAQARNLVTTLWNRLDHSGELYLSLRELRALALAGDNSALAQARASGRSDETGVNGL